MNNQKPTINFLISIRFLAALLASFSVPLVCIAQLPNATNSFTDELLDVTEHRLKIIGPDFEMAQFLSTVGESAWKRRDAFFDLTRGYLDDANVTKVSGAIDVFYRFRCYHPMEWLGADTFEKDNANFFTNLDAVVLGHFSYFKSLHNDDVYKSLSLYLGVSHSAEARSQLKEIAEATKNNEQALICLAWHRDAADMDFLLPYMLADSPASSSLPYHFRNSYGQAAIPYLQRAISEAKFQATREQAKEELKRIEK